MKMDNGIRRLQCGLVDHFCDWIRSNWCQVVDEEAIELVDYDYNTLRRWVPSDGVWHEDEFCWNPSTNHQKGGDLDNRDAALAAAHKAECEETERAVRDAEDLMDGSEEDHLYKEMIRIDNEYADGDELSDKDEKLILEAQEMVSEND